MEICLLSLLYHYILINRRCIIIIQIWRFVLISLLITLLYHYIFFKHSLCIAIHLSIFLLFHYIINVCNCYMLIHLSIILLYHYILINTKCHITDRCIIISPFPLYSTCILVFHFKHREWTLSLLYHYILIKQRCYVYWYSCLLFSLYHYI